MILYGAYLPLSWVERIKMIPLNIYIISSFLYEFYMGALKKISLWTTIFIEVRASTARSPYTMCGGTYNMSCYGGGGGVVGIEHCLTW